MYTVYRVFNISNKKSYIGMTTRLRARINQHKSYARCGDSRLLYRAIRKHGWDNFAIQVLDEFDNKKEALNAETLAVKQFNAHCNGYNETDDGKGHTFKKGNIPANAGRPMPAHVKKAILKANIGRIVSIETRKKMSEAHKGENHHFYGKKLSESHRKKLSESHKGQKHSEERKQKMSKIMKGRNHTWGNKISEARKGTKFNKVICPYCGKEGGGPNMTRYHFDNCKMA